MGLTHTGFPLGFALGCLRVVLQCLDRRRHGFAQPLWLCDFGAVPVQVGVGLHRRTLVALCVLCAFVAAYARLPVVLRVLGHSPLGAWSVYALLLFLLLQVASGLGSDDDVGFNGPLAPLLPSQWVALLTQYHADVGKGVLMSLIALHVLAVLFYTVVKRQALIQAMWHGFRQWPVAAIATVDTWRRRLWALAILAFVALGIAALLRLLPT